MSISCLSLLIWHWLLSRKINTSPTTVDDKDILKKMLTTPPVKKIDLHFPLGLEVTARNLKGVTIKDAMDAIHKQFKKRASLSPTKSTRYHELTESS
jgi:hypothetical protein